MFGVIGGSDMSLQQGVAARDDGAATRAARNGRNGGRRTTDDGAAPGICCMSTATAAEGRARRLGRLVRVRRCVRACVAWRAPGEGNRVETTDGCGSGSGSGSDGRAPAGGPPLSKGESAAGGLIGWRTCSSGGGAEPWRYVPLSPSVRPEARRRHLSPSHCH